MCGNKKETHLFFSRGLAKGGQLSLQILIYGGIAVIFLTGFFLWTEITLTSITRYSDTVLASMVAEAGIEYYRWHLAHAPSDYQDGTGAPGPYIHPYYDKNGNQLGQFILEITPPALGSTIVRVRSTGQLSHNLTVQKVLEVRMGIPSFARFAAVLNADVRFGAGTEVFGAIHSNGGIRFDGIANNLVTSALTSYDDPDHSGGYEFGVHTHAAPADPLPPAAVPNRTDIFRAGRTFPVPAVDFTAITQNLSRIKTDAQASGFYRGPSGAGNYGYDVVLFANDTFDVYRVTSLVPAPSGCTNYLSQNGWGTWSVQNRVLLGNYAIPANGLLFFEDDVWVRGQISGARITIASARFPDNPSTRSSITINTDLLYTFYDGTDNIGLIAQKNINIGMVSQDVIRVDAALIAQNGRVGRYYYRPPGGGSMRCSPYHARTTITSYGMIGSSQRYGFAYTDGTGYQTRNLTYDGNLLYGPPPSFPLTTDDYEIISWREVQ